jgi:hypothetical protein
LLVPARQVVASGYSNTGVDEKTGNVARVNLPGPDLERSVLAALWEHGPSRAREVHTLVGEPRGLAYTTIATALDRLHTKSLVERERHGKTFVYRTRPPRNDLESNGSRSRRNVAGR